MSAVFVFPELPKFSAAFKARSLYSLFSLQSANERPLLVMKFFSSREVIASTSTAAASSPPAPEEQ